MDREADGGLYIAEALISVLVEFEDGRSIWLERDGWTSGWPRARMGVRLVEMGMVAEATDPDSEP